jgi:survival of motor neuron protein-interacting protein 1
MDIISSDEEEYGRKKSLPVADFDDYDPNIPPVTGEEYLRRVQLEAAKCPKVVVAEYPQLKEVVDHKEINEYIGIGSDVNSSIIDLPLDAQQELVSEFSRTRTRLELMRDMLSDEEKKKARSHHPKISNVFYYKRWCLGNDISSDSSDEEVVDSKSVRRPSRGKGQKNPPVKERSLPIKFLLSLDQQEVLTLLQLQTKWITDYDFNAETSGQWLHSLLSALEKPLDSEGYSVLREVCRCIKRLRSNSDDDREDSDRHRSMDLIVCIICRYFDQRDLL